MAENEGISEQAQKPEGESSGQDSSGSEAISKDARMWAMWCHLSGLAGLLPIVPGIGCVIAPLIVWQMKKEESPFVDENGKEALNFQISMLIYGIVAGLLILACVGMVLLPAVVIVDVVFLIIAALKANKGEHYRYPLTIRLVK
jgi:uncharacterized Tic20 family protein